MLSRPTGRRFATRRITTRIQAASTNNDLWIVPVSGGPAKNITADNPASDTSPLYSPDGRYIAYRAQQRPGYESDRFRLMLYDRKTGEKKDLTEDFDHWVGTFAWAPDSKTIYFGAEHKRHSLDLRCWDDTRHAGDSRRSVVGGFDDDLAVTPDGKTLVFTRMSIKAPIEIFAADAAGEGCPARTGNVDEGKESCSSEQRLADHSRERPIALASQHVDVESFWFKVLTATRSKASWSSRQTSMPRRNIP